MGEVLQFVKDAEVWIYLLLGLGGLFLLGKFIRAWEDLRQATFGLERESAQMRINYVATGLVLLLLLAAAEFMLVSFVIPLVPMLLPLATPTMDLLATPTAVMPTTDVNITPGQLQMVATLTPAGVAQGSSQSGCIPNQIMIAFPVSGSTVQGIVTIEGSATIPNFGYYKFEISRPGEEKWLAIQAWTKPVQNGILGQWDTSRLEDGLYQLRLVVSDNQNNSYPPCVIELNIVTTTP